MSRRILIIDDDESIRKSFVLALEEVECKVDTADMGRAGVEMAEKGLDAFPQEYLLIRLEYISENERRLSFEPQGEHYSNLVSELCN